MWRRLAVLAWLAACGGTAVVDGGDTTSGGQGGSASGTTDLDPGCSRCGEALDTPVTSPADICGVGDALTDPQGTLVCSGPLADSCERMADLKACACQSCQAQCPKCLAGVLEPGACQDCLATACGQALTACGADLP
ncbi:MAG: hypothetical protein R3B72_13495 [Polyangiaceae bacterium]